MPYRGKEYKNKEKLRKTRQSYNRKYYDKTAGYPKRPWTEDEIKMLFSDKYSDRELSNILERSMQAILQKRCRVRKERSIPI